MYDSSYAEAWIKSYESRKDSLRVEYLEPYLKKVVKGIPSNYSILDIGSGWGTLIPFLKKNHTYTGVDLVSEFFLYIQSKFPKNKLILIKDSLPKLISINKKYDVIFCSMVLHTVSQFSDSLKSIFERMHSKSKLILIDFNDTSEEMLRKSVVEVYNQDDDHIRGKVKIVSGDIVESDIYFHKEADIERLLKTEGNFRKKYLGPIFVAYVFTKK